MAPRALQDRLFIFRPPYRELVPLVRASALEAGAGRRGDVLVWCMSPSASATVMQDVRQRPFGMSLVGVLPPAEAMGDRGGFYRMIEQCFPETLLPYHEEPNPFDLHSLLKLGPYDFAHDLVDYLTWRGVSLHASLQPLVLRTLELSKDVTSVERLAKSVYLSRRALGRRLHSAGVPSPSHWLHFGRTFRAIVRLQSGEASVQRVAMDLGYADGFALSNQMQRLAGIRPSEARSRVGWMWFVEAWVKAEAKAGGFSSDRYPALWEDRHRKIQELGFDPPRGRVVGEANDNPHQDLEEGA
jgi:AraC-like DNA-binding protein